MTKMKRIVLLILVLLLMVDLAEDGCLGKATPYLPSPSSKTSVTSSHNRPVSDRTDFRCELAFTGLWRSLPYSNGQLVILHVPPTLQILHCCYLSSSGGISL
jgi:hypothetical protein